MKQDKISETGNYISSIQT